MEERICPILDRPTRVERTPISRDSWSIVRCSETGFLFLANPPAYARLESEFAWEKTYAEVRDAKNRESPSMARASRFAKRVKFFLFPSRNKMAALAESTLSRFSTTDRLRIVDIGCGAGELMREVHRRCGLQGRDLELVGIEVSNNLAALTESRIATLGGQVLRMNAVEGTAALAPGSVHLALMSSFLEHECQPLRLLKQLRIALAPQGAVVLKVPNYDCWNRVLRGASWPGYRFPDHVNYFTPDTLRRLALEAGFSISRQGILDRLPFSDNMYAVLKKSA